MQKRKLYFLLVIVLLILVSYNPLIKAQVEPPVTVFIIDTEVDFSFVKNLTMTGEITHGSVVGRIIYQEVPKIKLRAYNVEQNGEIDKALYYDALEKIAAYQSQHPHERILLNVSLGFSQATTEHKSLINNLVKQGVVIIAAGGNESSQQAIYPAGFKGPVAVGNATAEGKAASSNYGEFIDICAPGDVKYISRLYLPQGVTVKSFKAVGTSFSAPRVVALLAELLTMQSNLSPARAIDLISNNAEKIADPKYEQGLLGTGVIARDKTLAQVDSYYYFKNYGMSFVWGLLFISLSVYWFNKYQIGGLFLTLLFFLVALPLAFLMQELLLGNVQHSWYLYQQLEVVDYLYLVLVPLVMLKITSWQPKFVVVNYLLGLLLLVLNIDLAVVLSWAPATYLRSGLGLISLLLFGGERLRINQVKQEENMTKLISLLSSYSQKTFKISKRKLKTSNYSLQVLIKKMKQEEVEFDLIKKFIFDVNNDHKLLEKLLNILKEDDLLIEDTVIDLLSEMQTKELFNMIKEKLKQAKPSLQNSLLKLLEKINYTDQEIVDIVTNILFSTTDMWLGYQSLVTLKNICSSNKKLKEIIKPLTTDSRDLVQLEAKKILTELNSKR